MMAKFEERTKKFFCARCFLPIDTEDKVDIEGQNFHKICSMCCICRTMPLSVKMFYGHVFCNDCFKAHVLCRHKNDCPGGYSNSWWKKWVSGTNSQETKNTEPKSSKDSTEELPKRSICSRCLQPVEENCKVDIGDQSFHTLCAKCYFCQEIPSKIKIYYGQVFCEECFHRHVLNRNKDNPSEFFKNCFEHWQNNAQFAENMRQFMSGNRENVPFVFMMQGPQPPFCRCGTGPQEWFQPNEPKKSATPTMMSNDESMANWDLSLEYPTEVSEIPESSNVIDESANQENFVVAAAQKIEKLTKYFHESKSYKTKKWKNFNELDKAPKLEIDETYRGWVNLQDPKVIESALKCPKCLWQCGPIYVNSEYLKERCFRR